MESEALEPHRRQSLFVPTEFEVPQILETAQFRLRMLSVEDVDKDYDAVISSAENLRNAFPQWDGWPRAGFTLAENREDLKRHQNEFERREGFTYTVVSLDESTVLGCVYIYPSKAERAHAEILMWVRKSAYEEGLDPVLFQTVNNWIRDKWPFETVIYPGRE